MSKQFRNTAAILAVFTFFISACQAAAPVVPTQAPTTPPPTAIPSQIPVPTKQPSHPEARPDAIRLDFMGSTMRVSPGSCEPNTSMQTVFNAVSGQKISLNLTTEPASGLAVSLWGADGTVLIPETTGISSWEGILLTGQDYYLNYRSVLPQPVGFTEIIKLPPLVLPEATRIQFQPNTSGWYTPGEVQPNETLRFVLGAQSGQQMTASLKTQPADADTFLYIWSPDGTVYTLMAPTKEWSGLLPASQDYYLEVRSFSKQPVPYQLSVNIPAIGAAGTAPSEPVPQLAYGARIAVDKPVRFDAGPMALELNGAVLNGERDRYILNALAGEKLSVLISSQEGNAVFSIIGPDQNPLPGTEEGKDVNNWSVPIFIEGSYAILVGSTRGNATYTLKVEVNK
jgi:hypothetical protein